MVHHPLFDRNCSVGCLTGDVVEQLTEEGHAAQQLGIAGEDELATGACQCHVQLSVYECAVVVGERGGGEELQLGGLADRKRVDDDVALRALIAFYSVDADVEQLGQVQFCYFTTYEGYLVAVGHDNADASIGIEAITAYLAIEATQYVGYQGSLG